MKKSVKSARVAVFGSGDMNCIVASSMGITSGQSSLGILASFPRYEAGEAVKERETYSIAVNNRNGLRRRVQQRYLNALKYVEDDV